MLPLKIVHVDNAADIEKDDDFRIVFADKIDIVFFVFGEVIITGFGLAVSAFAGVSGYDVDGGIRRCIDVAFFDPGKCGSAEAVLKISIREGYFLLFGVVFDTLFILSGMCCEDGIVTVEPAGRGDLEACLFKAFANGYDISRIDFAGAGSAPYGMACAVAEECDLPRLPEGKRAVILEEHRTFGGEVFYQIHVVDLSGRYFV